MTKRASRLLIIGPSYFSNLINIATTSKLHERMLKMENYLLLAWVDKDVIRSLKERNLLPKSKIDSGK